tara:strand:+ start:206 stop:487 length:282 start_codon:yes stop_codon:yes gene_type:complete
MAGYVGGGSSGGGGGSSTQVIENLTSQIDGITQDFTTTYSYQAGSLAIYWNGICQIVSGTGATINETSSTGFSFIGSTVPTTAHTLTVQYLKS